MKLTSIQNKIEDSISDSIRYKCFYKTNYLISYDMRRKIDNEIWTPNMESISGIQIIILDNLQNEIN